MTDKAINRINELSDAFGDQLVTIRREFHMHPEVSLNEYNTAKKIEAYLTEWGIPFERIAKTGVVAMLEGKYPGKVVAVRADTDALPIQEVDNRSYRSVNDGVMHACGHDVHIAILLGVVKTFKEMNGNFRGKVKFFFQPAEEAFGGAKMMIEAGCMENPTVDHVIGLHVLPHLEVGKLELGYDVFCAMACEVNIKIIGQSGHAAKPDQAIDAVAIAGQMITNLNMLVSRNVSPLDSVVLTFGSVHGGTKSNIIADEVILKGTLRTLGPEMRIEMEKRINEIATHVAKAHGGRVEVYINEGYPALINNNDVVNTMIGIGNDLVGEENLRMMVAPSMGGEDFSFFSNHVPSAFYNLGSGNVEKGITAALHNIAFDVDEDCMPIGVKMQVNSALKLMENIE